MGTKPRGGGGGRNIPCPLLCCHCHHHSNSTNWFLVRVNALKMNMHLILGHIKHGDIQCNSFFLL